MAWEKRGDNLYYYRKKRHGRQVTSDYVGGGRWHNSYLNWIRKSGKNAVRLVQNEIL